MSFVQFLNSPAVSYLLSGVVVVLLGVVGTLLHNGIKRLEGYLDARLSPGDALKVNDFLNTVDYLTGLAVQDANNRMVVGLKANGLFSKEVADSVKQAVVNDVLTNLGPLKTQFSSALGPLENIIAQAVEKHVLSTRPQTDAAIQSAKASGPTVTGTPTSASTSAPTSAPANTAIRTDVPATPNADVSPDTHSLEKAVENVVENAIENAVETALKNLTTHTVKNENASSDIPTTNYSPSIPNNSNAANA